MINRLFQVGIIVYRLANWPSCECCSFIMIAWTILSTGGISSSSRWTPTVRISCKMLEEAVFPEVLEEFQVTKMNWFTWDKWSNCTPYPWDSPLQQMLLRGEQREEQSQAVIEGHVPAAEQAHMGAIQGSAERSSRQSHKPGVPDGERHDLHIYPKQAGADCVL